MISPSAPTPAPEPAIAARKSFALAGRSRMLDPTRHAVRKDLADVRLADQVFAPHYAAPLPRRLVTAAPLRTDRSADSEQLASLSAGDAFDLLDITGGSAWGVATESGLVGYVDASALGDGD